MRRFFSDPVRNWMLELGSSLVQGCWFLVLPLPFPLIHPYTSCRLAPQDMGLNVFIDGRFFDERQAKVSVFDHGLLYGDGIFEGIRAYNGRVFKLKEHIDRLRSEERRVGK